MLYQITTNFVIWATEIDLSPHSLEARSPKSVSPGRNQGVSRVSLPLKALAKIVSCPFSIWWLLAFLDLWLWSFQSLLPRSHWVLLSCLCHVSFSLYDFDTSSDVCVFFLATKQFSDPRVSYSSTQLWNRLPGESSRLHRFRTRTCTTAIPVLSSHVGCWL